MDGNVTTPTSTANDEDSAPNPSDSPFGAFFPENMATILYVLAGAAIVVCVVIHGCLFYQRWRRRILNFRREDKEIGETSLRTVQKDKITGGSRENSIVSCTDSDKRSRSDSCQLQNEGKSSTKSLLDQDLNERRRSSSVRIKVLPSPAIIRSTSGPENFKRESDPQPARAAVIAQLTDLCPQKALKPFTAGQSDPPRPTCDTDKVPNDVNSSSSEQNGGSASHVASIPKADNPGRSPSGSHRALPAILHTQPSEEKYDQPETRDPTKRPPATRQNKDSSEVIKLKRRSYSLDNVPALEAFRDLIKPQWQTLGPVRNRSASECPQVPKGVKSLTGASKLEPVYFTLEPGPETFTPSRNDKRYQTLPPIKTTAEQPTSPVKRKFTLFPRKSRRTEKRRDKQGAQTPPSSPGKSSVDENQCAIYEEPEGARGAGKNSLRSQSTDNQLNEGADPGRKSDDGSPLKIKPFLLKSFQKSRTKIKSFTTKSTPQKRPAREVCDDLAYEVLEIPMDDSAAADTPVYDTPESDLSSNREASKNVTVIGTTRSGSPLKQYKPGSARRELPNTPSEYDVIERGVISPQGVVSRSKSAKPNVTRESPKTSANYAKLGPMVPDRIKGSDLSKSSSSPETPKLSSEQVYDLLNPDTMGSPDPPNGAKPRVKPKPHSLRGPPKSSDYNLLHFGGPLSRHGSFGAGSKPKLAPRPLLRANSLGKLRKVSPEASPQPSQNSKIKSGQPSSKVGPSISSKPVISQKPKTAEPVYFTLDPNSISEHI